MAGHNNRKGGGNSNNYFAQNIQKNGAEFLEYKNARNIENEAPKICRDLARGNIDIEKYGFYFLDMHFLNNLINAANNQIGIFGVSFEAVNMMVQNYQYRRIQVTPQILGVLNYHKQRYEAWSIILQGLTALKTQKDLNYLYVMISNLQNYKYVI